jgi:2,4-dienoyl-CoA reductase (NADPH2)
MRDPLFEPIGLNRLELKNRISMPAMHLNMAHNFEVTDRIRAFYEQRARGGAAMICVGYATVDELSGTSLNIGAHRDELIPGLRGLAQTISQAGARSAVQLNHAGRYNISFLLDGQTPVAPSAVASRMTKETPRALETEEVGSVIESFVRAGERVKEAGFDAVEILCGTGYLISEFLSPLTNERTDAYGGSPAHRMRFGLEILQGLRERLGRDYPLIVRLNGNDLMESGIGRQELQEFAVRLVDEAKVDALNVNVGWHEAGVPQITSGVPRAGFAYLAREIRERTKVPVIASHRINDPWTARELIGAHMCDLVALGRGLIADPDLPRKAEQGREQEIIHCIGCGQGCFDHILQLKPVGCLANPEAGREHEPRAEPAQSAKHVLVVGGGPAGMSAAIAAHDRGHRVRLVEAADRLGGQLHIAAAPPGRAEFQTLAEDLAAQVRTRNIELILGHRASAGWIQEQRPDEVVLCTGARPMVPAIPGADAANVCQAWDVLLRKAWTGQRVVVLGGGAVGVETALFLAQQGTLGGEELKFLLVNEVEPCDHLLSLCRKGSKEVILVEMLERLGRDIGKSTRWTMLQELKRFGVQARTTTRALAISPEGLKAETGGEEELIPADSVVLAVGSAPSNPLQSELESIGLSCSVVGDASQPAQAMQAIHAAHNLGKSL